MSLQSLVFYTSLLSARRGVSTYTIAHRCGWNDGAAEDFLRERRAPTPKMLKDLASELDVTAKNLNDCLER